MWQNVPFFIAVNKLEFCKICCMLARILGPHPWLTPCKTSGTAYQLGSYTLDYQNNHIGCYCRCFKHEISI